MMNLLNPLANIPADKQGHFLVGVLLYAGFHFAHPLVGIAVVITAAFAKEVYDYLHQDKHTPDVWDAVATIAGGVIGLIAGL